MHHNHQWNGFQCHNIYFIDKDGTKKYIKTSLVCTLGDRKRNSSFPGVWINEFQLKMQKKKKTQKMKHASQDYALEYSPVVTYSPSDTRTAITFVSDKGYSPSQALSGWLWRFVPEEIPQTCRRGIGYTPPLKVKRGDIWASARDSNSSIQALSGPL